MDAKVTSFIHDIEEEFKKLTYKPVKKINGEDIIYEKNDFWLDINTDGQIWFSISKEIDGEPVTLLNREYDLEQDEVEQVIVAIIELIQPLLEGVLYAYVESYSHLGMLNGSLLTLFRKEEDHYIKLDSAASETLLKDKYSAKEMNALKGRILLLNA